jgi:hypothetical protein
MYNTQPQAASTPGEIQIPQASVLPRFSGAIGVSQHRSEGMWVVLLFSMLGVLPGAVLMDLDAASWMQFLCVAGMVLGMIAGMLLGTVLIMRWETRKGQVLFSKTTQVTIDQDGVNINDLGLLSWQDVLSYEGIPDSTSAMIIFSRQYGELLLQDIAVDELIPILNAHLESARANNFTEAMTQVFRFKAVIFHWPKFMAWIVAGYVLSVTLGLFLVLNAPNAGAFKTIVGLMLLVPTAAWLLWIIPFSQIDLFSARYTKAFELRDALLVSSDGQWEVDLREADVSFRKASGIGYAFDFVSIRPHRGGRLDLLMDVPELQKLSTCLESRDLMCGDGSQG